MESMQKPLTQGEEANNAGNSSSEWAAQNDNCQVRTTFINVGLTVFRAIARRQYKSGQEAGEHKTPKPLRKQERPESACEAGTTTACVDCRRESEEMEAHDKSWDESAYTC